MKIRQTKKIYNSIHLQKAAEIDSRSTLTLKPPAWYCIMSPSCCPNRSDSLKHAHDASGLFLWLFGTKTPAEGYFSIVDLFVVYWNPHGTYCKRCYITNSSSRHAVVFVIWNRKGCSVSVTRVQLWATLSAVSHRNHPHTLWSQHAITLTRLATGELFMVIIIKQKMRIKACCRHHSTVTSLTAPLSKSL